MKEQMIEIGSVKMPLNDFVISRNAILGITKSGKTYCAKGVAEQLLERKIPIIVFDAIGVWRYLKVPSGKTGGKGFQIVVAGGSHPDLPLTPHSAPEIVRAAIKENIPLIIDLYDAKLSKADWRKIVQDCFRILLYENKGLRHIFLEESAEYAPQKVMDGQTYAEVEKLARMGGNASLGITFINQRAQELNKAVLELCDNIILLRQRGTHAIDSLEKQMDKLSPDMAKEIALTMPNMTQGDCWIFTETGDVPVRTRSNPLLSFHPDRRNPNENQIAQKSVNTDAFVHAVSMKLGKVIEEAKANDPVELKRQLAAAKRDIARLESAKPQPVKVEIKEVSILTDSDRKLLSRSIDGSCMKIIESFENLQSRITESVMDMKNFFDPIRKKLSSTGNVPAPKPDHRLQTTTIYHPRTMRVGSPEKSEDDGNVGKGAREVLKAAAQNPDGVTDEQIAVLTGYKKTSRTTFKQQLFSKGFLAKGGRGFVATESGIEWLGKDFEPLPVGDALREHWMRKLSGGELECFKVYVQEWPSEVSTEGLMERTGYLKTSVTTFRQKLSARNLISGKKASDNLFG
jgi:hypothetical protein